VDGGGGSGRGGVGGGKVVSVVSGWGVVGVWGEESAWKGSKEAI